MKYLYITLLMIPVFCLHAYAISIPENPGNYVTDLAGVIDDSIEEMLNTSLYELERNTSAQAAVLVIDSLEGKEIRKFSQEIARKWQLGQKDRNNGLLLLISIQDRRYRFAVGYGLENLLSESLLYRIGERDIKPFFRKGDYSNGVKAAMHTIAEIINQEDDGKGRDE